MSRESSRCGISLDVFGGGHQQIVFVADAIKRGNIVAAQRLRRFGFIANPLNERITILHLIETHYLQCDRLLGFAVDRLVDGGERRLRKLAYDLEPANFFGHCVLCLKRVLQANGIRRRLLQNHKFFQADSVNYRSTQSIWSSLNSGWFWLLNRRDGGGALVSKGSLPMPYPRSPRPAGRKERQ